MNFNNFKSDLIDTLPEKILFVALGNELRGDDFAGILFTIILRETEPFNKSEFIFAGTNPENFLDQFINTKAELIVFIDAITSKGLVKNFNWLSSDLIDKVAISTHSFSIKLVDEFIKIHCHKQIKYFAIDIEPPVYADSISKEINCRILNFFNNNI